MIEYFETRFEKSKKATAVDVSDFTFKSEGNKIIHSFYSERLEKLSTIERCLQFNKIKRRPGYYHRGKGNSLQSVIKF